MARKGTHIFAGLQSLLTWRRRSFTLVAVMGLSLILTLASGLLNQGVGNLWPSALLAQTRSSQSQQLLQQGREAFQAGQFAAAIQFWQQAAQRAVTEGDRNTQAIALSNLALAYQQQGNWPQVNTAIVASVQALSANSPPQVRAQVFNTQGKLQFAIGQFEPALASWQRATNDYNAVPDPDGVTLSLLNQTEALKALGLHRRANTLLESLYRTRQQQPIPLQLTTLLNYGDNLRLLGRLTPTASQTDAPTVLQEGLALAQRSQSPTAIVSALVSLGNTARSQQQLQATRYADRPNQLQSIYQQELRFYQQGEAFASPDIQRLVTELRSLQTFTALPDLTAAQQAQVQAQTATIRQQLNALPPSRDSVYGYLQLAESLITIGGDPAKTVPPILATAASQAETIGDFQIQSYALWRQEYYQAWQYYQQAAAIAAANALSPLPARLNLQSLLLDGSEETANSRQQLQAAALTPTIQAEIERLPPSHSALYNQIQFAQNRVRLGDAANLTAAVKLLEKVGQQAEQLGDVYAQSYALGNLGKIYQQQRQWQPAQTYTERALSLAKAVRLPILAYRWQWQLGQLLKAQQDTPGAIAAYTDAVNSLNSVRKNLATINTDNEDVQFSFRLNAEPVYLELVDLLLQPGAAPSQQNLEQARSVIESLQIAEIENFFQQACAPASVEIEGVDPQAAIVYPIVLPDRLEIILSLYDASAPKRIKLRHYALPIPAETVEQTANLFRQSLLPSAPTQDRFTYGRQLYDWLIRPATADLTRAGAKTLVFILNGNLRNVPMAALHDGNQFLIQNYQVALTPGLQLIDPQPLKRQNLNALLAGLTEARPGFPALPNIESEIQTIHSIINSQVVLNEQLTNQNLEKTISKTPFNTIHLATHGQFSSNADQTFILTWDQKLNVREFDALLRTSERNDSVPVELLVLSACQTASGDKRAALGLAGVAVRSGARSTIGSLWPVNDETTSAFMSSFYAALNRPGMSKAAALSLAQRDLLTKYPSPYYWAPFVLVGNWL
jgi:CHAT domain-containing protein